MIKVGAEKRLRNAPGSFSACLISPENLWDAFPSTFSSGEKQRINLIRYLINFPELVFLDELTVSLNVKSRGIILDIIKEMTLRKITILCVFHNEPELERLADDILDMDHVKVTRPS